MGRVTHWNRAAEKFTGIKAEEATGNPIKKVLPFFNENTEAISETIQKKQIQAVSFNLERGGADLCYEIGIYPLDSDHAEGALVRINDVTDQKLSEKEYIACVNRYRHIFNYTHDAIFVFDIDGSIIDVNDKMLEMYRIGYEQAKELKIEDFTGPSSSVADALPYWKRVVKGEKIVMEWDAKRPIDGSLFKAEVSLNKIEVNDDEVIIAVVKDITYQKKAEQAVREGEEKFRLISEHALLGILIIQDSSIQYCNQAACDLIGYDETALLAWDLDSLTEIVHIDDRSYFEKSIQKIQKKEPADIIDHSTYRLVHSNGRIVWVDQFSRTIHYKERPAMLASLVDITDKKKNEDEIVYLAYNDVLTGLPNRKSFFLNLEEHIEQSKRRQDDAKWAMLFLDLDNFKNVNDSMGHEAGDVLLKEISMRLQHCLRRSDKIYRLGSDEFTIILNNIKNDFDAARVADKILSETSKPCRINDYDLYISVSIGISIYPDDGNTVEMLLKSADMAMYAAKEGKEGYRFFTSEMNEIALERIKLESDLRKAIRENEFVLHYQPIYDDDDCIIGVEALIRWQHPTRGMIYPSKFIPVAEDTGAIIPIGRWVMYHACKQIKIWNDINKKDLFISVNVSTHQIKDPTFANTVVQILEYTGLPPDLLKIEITESLIMQNPENTIKNMKNLRDKGIEFSIDDFGTGYSSLNYLKKLPIDTLKIDRSFVIDSLMSRDDREIIKTIIAISKNLGINTVAEGVESLEHKEFLKDAGCKMMQGFYFNKPMPQNELEDIFSLTNINPKKK